MDPWTTLVGRQSELTDAVAGSVRLASTRADDGVAVSAAVVEPVAARAGACHAAERALDVVTVACDAAVVRAQPTLVIVSTQHTSQGFLVLV